VTRTTKSWLSERGYNVVEMMFVLGFMGILASMAVIQINTSRPGMKADGGLRIVLGQMNQAREMAITQRRYMRVVLTTPNTVAIVREDTTSTTTTLSTIPIEGGVVFALTTGVPDTPDAFGNSSAIYWAGTPTNVKFTPDGTLVNQNGATTNGSVFLAWQNMTLAARAITVLGSTGRVRGYKWDGRSWKLV
jgi:Tfp pilus assembly protein FimT